MYVCVYDVCGFETTLHIYLSQPEHFPFLNVNLELKCHTMFYLALGRLLLVELGEDEEKFERFITPLTSEHTPRLHLQVTMCSRLIHHVAS